MPKYFRTPNAFFVRGKEIKGVQFSEITENGENIQNFYFHTCAAQTCP